MAKNKKIPKKQNPVPKGLVYIEQDGDFKLYKKWNRDTTAKDPFYIADNLEDFIEEIEASCTKWRIKLDLKELYKFINTHKTDQNEETDFLKSYPR